MVDGDYSLEKQLHSFELMSQQAPNTMRETSFSIGQNTGSALYFSILTHGTNAINCCKVVN
jgi:hypothetical protein